MILFTLILLVSFLFGCTQCGDESNVRSGCEVISIGDAFEKKSKVPLSEYACAIDYIPLETAPECMLPGATLLQVRSFEDRLYFYNGMQALATIKTAPLCFKSDGSFISLIGSVGKSDNEFLHVKDMMINASDRQLVILDYNRFLFHTLDGKFIKSVDVEINSLLKFSIFCNGNDGFVYLKNPSLHDGGVSWDKDYLVKIDSAGVVQSKFSLKRKFLYKTGTADGTVKTSVGAALLKSMESLYVYMHNDTLYRLDPSDMKLETEMFLDFGKYASTAEKLGAKLFTISNPLFITPDFVALTVLFTYSVFRDIIDKEYIRTNFVYDRKRGTTRALEYNEEYGYAGFTNDIDGGMLFYPKYMNEGKMYQLVDAIDFIEYAQKSNSQKMKQVAATLTEESNPVVVVATLKE